MTEDYTNTIDLITGDQLAKEHGYSYVTSQCRSWWRATGIHPVPGRRNMYDRKLVRQRLDAVQGMSAQSLIGRDKKEMSLVQRRKGRKNAH